MDGDMIGVNQQAKAKSGISTPLFMLFVLCCLSFDMTFAAEILPDPTRPATEAGLTGTAPTAASGPVLQSVMIRPGQRTAMINGQLLAEGERFGDAKLVKISEGEVILVGPEGRQTLKLFPGVEKQLARPPQDETRKRGKSKSKTQL